MSRFIMHLPDDWSAEQALSVYEMLRELAEAIWDRYEEPVIDMLMTKPMEHNPSQHELFDFDDDLSF